MRIIYPLIVSLLLAGTLSAQYASEVLAPFDFVTNFQDVFVAPSGDGWAVGNCAVLAKTTNNGTDWELLTAPNGLDYSAVACVPGTDCQSLYVAGDGIIAWSTDGGQSWTDVEAPTNDPREFHFLDDNVIVLSHSNESVLRSTDGGANWTEITFEYTYRGTAHFPSNDAGYLFLQSGGPLLKTTDAGATWDSIYQFEANAYYGSWLDENTGFLYDQNRRVFKTVDGGNDWTLVTDTGVPSNMRYMAAISEMELVAYVFPSNIFRSTDGGVTWANNPDIAEWQTGLRYVGIHNNGDDFWLASWGTEILYSNDGLETATSQFPAPRPRFEQMSFPTDEVGYALQERWGMFKTTDGGDSWTQITTDFFTVSRDFLVLDEETVIIPYNSSGPQKTEDGGATWGPLFPSEIQDTTFVFHIEQLPGGRLYLMGSVHGAYSDDNGESWNVIYHGYSTFPRSMVFVDDMNGYVGSDQGRLLATTNGGESWDLVVSGDFTTQPISNLFVLDDNTILNTVSGFTRCSSDGGYTWSTDACGGVEAPGAIVEGPDGTLYSGRLFPSSSDLLSNVQRSLDRGLTWEEISGFCSYAIPGAVTPNNQYLYLYQSSGFLGRVDLNPVGTDDIKPSAVTAAKVYPNPVNAQLWVDLPEESPEAQCSLFDLNGRLLQQQQLQGPTGMLDVSTIPAGMYLIKLQGDGWLQSARVIVQ